MHNYDLEMSAENISKVDSKYELLKKLTEKKTV